MRNLLLFTAFIAITATGCQKNATSSSSEDKATSSQSETAKKSDSGDSTSDDIVDGDHKSGD